MDEPDSKNLASNLQTARYTAICSSWYHMDTGKPSQRLQYLQQLRVTGFGRTSSTGAREPQATSRGRSALVRRKITITMSLLIEKMSHFNSRTSHTARGTLLGATVYWMALYDEPSYNVSPIVAQTPGTQSNHGRLWHQSYDDPIKPDYDDLGCEF